MYCMSYFIPVLPAYTVWRVGCWLVEGWLREVSEEGLRERSYERWEREERGGMEGNDGCTACRKGRRTNIVIDVTRKDDVICFIVQVVVMT